MVSSDDTARVSFVVLHGEVVSIFQRRAEVTDANNEKGKCWATGKREISHN